MISIIVTEVQTVKACEIISSDRTLEQNQIEDNKGIKIDTTA